VTPRLTGGVVLLLALLVGAAALVGVELGKGAARSVSPAIANPCRARAPFAGGGIDGVIQRIVLNGLDGAACRLGTSREELVLSLRSGTGVRLRNADRNDAEAAIRAGLLRSVDEADSRGDIPSFLVPVVRRLIRTAPLDTLIQGGITLGNLFG
jgi:hypothetical protein